MTVYVSVCQGSAGSLGATGSGGVSDLYSCLRRRRRHHQLQVPPDWRADPQTPYPDLQEELPPQPQGTCRSVCLSLAADCGSTENDSAGSVIKRCV